MRSQAAAEEAGEGEEDVEKPPDVVFEGGFRIPGDLYGRLFDYQKTGKGLGFMHKGSWDPSPHVAALIRRRCRAANA